jgi:hypothetical protein
MTVKIEIYGENAKEALFELRDFSAGLQGSAARIAVAEAQNYAAEQGQPPVDNDHVAEGAAAFTAAEVTANATSGRVRGQPAPGKARRTKAEIAEDDAADAGSETTGAISTNPENRVGPEDDAETETQDAADEAAEVEEGRDAEEPLTADDLRQAVGRYNAKFGMEATVANINGIIGSKQSDVPNTQEALAAAIAKVDAAIAAGGEPTKATAETAKPLTIDDVFVVVKGFVEKFGGPKAEELGPGIFESALGTPPEGERFWKRSILPTDQKSLKACFDGWTKALGA